jgi:thiosulfate/3-mercaptopyruvate sulfurtransferase
LKHFIHIAIVLGLCLGIGVSQAKTDSAAEMLVQSDWLAAHLNDPGLVVLHVGVDRTAYDGGHISGARFLAWSDITVARNGVPNQLPAADVLKAALERVGVGDGSRVIVYGDTPLLAGHTYFVLDYLGHGSHSMLDGGLERWKAEKRPVNKTRPEVAAAKLTVTIHPELLVDLAAVQKIVAEKKIPLIDGRPPAQYSGATPGDDIKRGGHIPSARNVWWMQTIVSKENPVLKPIAEIRALYEAAGAKLGEDVLVYCRTGPIAMHEYFTLKLAGFSPVLYNGSFLEWSNATGTAVETGTGGSR